MEDQDKIRREEEDVEAHRASRKHRSAAEEPTDEAQGSDDDVELHGRRKHRA